MDQNIQKLYMKMIYERIEDDLEFSTTKKATDEITYELMSSADEAIKEVLEYNDPDIEKWTDKDKIKWIRVMLSCIQSSIERAEDDGYVSNFIVNYQVQKDDLDNQLRNVTQTFVYVIMDINRMYDRLEEENEFYENQKVEDYAKDPVFSKLNINQIKKRLENENKKSKKRRMQWNAWLDEVQYMMCNFEEERDSDVDDASDEDHE
jgi:hypothetical protein